MENKIFKQIILVISLALTLACNQQKSKWQGTIEKLDGLIIVKNSVESMFGTEIIKITEELSIKEETGNEELLFGMLVGLCVDDDDNIYAVDMQAGYIKVFDELGNYKFNIGRKGQGPGEFIMPFRIKYIALDKIMVLDVSNYRILWFLTNGDLLREVSAAALRPSRLESDLSDNLVVRVSRRTEDGFIDEIIKLDSQLNELHKIATLEEKPTPDGKFPMQIPLIQFHIAPNGHVIWANESRYEFYEVDEHGDMVTHIINEYNPLKITETERKRLIELNFGDRGAPGGREPTFPDYFLPFNDFLIDDKGRIIVRTYKRTSEGITIYDIFDVDGRFLVSIPLKSFPQVWKQNGIYFIETDEEGYQYIKRYKVTWNY